MKADLETEAGGRFMECFQAVGRGKLLEDQRRIEGNAVELSECAQRPDQRFPRDLSLLHRRSLDRPKGPMHPSLTAGEGGHFLSLRIGVECAGDESARQHLPPIAYPPFLSH